MGHQSPSQPAARPRVRRGNADDAQRLRSDLLAAAAALFDAGGLEAVSMRGVASRVGVSAMTPYRYFADKAALLRGLWVQVLQGVYAAMRQAVDAERGGRARQHAVIEAFLLYWEAHPDQFRLVYQTQGATGHDPTQALAQDPVYADLLALVRAVTLELAAEIGAGLAHIELSEEIRFAMQLGYLQAALVNRRYPWGERAVLRAAYVEQVVAAVERSLLDGPPRLPRPPGDAGAAAQVSAHA